MAIESIIRSKGGKSEREVQLSDIAVHDIRTSPVFLPDERWIGAVERYYNDLCSLLATIRAGLSLPDEFFIPDLWDTSNKLTEGEREMMLDMWHLGYDLAKAAGYQLTDVKGFARNGGRARRWICSAVNCGGCERKHASGRHWFTRNRNRCGFWLAGLVLMSS